SKEFGCGLSVRADVQYVAGVYTDFENILKPDNRGDQGKIPGHRVYNASASYQISKKFKAFVSGKNLLDNIYIGSRLHSNPRQKTASLSSGILPGSRRQVNIGLKFQL
ncbi:TonB-dependent receptor, partial [Cytophagaceae bacterium AH-315-L13]|nr:TonB-dependent receptor [Cytophagaceae bacterium AH-315-L13]